MISNFLQISTLSLPNDFASVSFLSAWRFDGAVFSRRHLNAGTRGTAHLLAAKPLRENVATVPKAWTCRTT